VYDLPALEKAQKAVANDLAQQQSNLAAEQARSVQLAANVKNAKGVVNG